MPSTIGQLSQYRVQMALSATPTTLAVIPNRIVSCRITRGRSDETSTMQPGLMTLVLDNGDGAFSPDNASSPYAGFLVPGRRVEVDARFDTATPWNPLYFGYIDSIRPEDNGPLDGNVIIQCVDWLGLMSIRNITGNVSSGGAGSHDLINWFASLMTLIDSAISRSIVNPTDGTSQNLFDFAYTNVAALQALGDFAATVRGVVFAGADGTVRATANGGTATTTLFNTFFTFDQPITNPAANVVPYTTMDYDLTTQYLYNDITVEATSTWEGAYNVQDAASISAYGKRSLPALQFPYMGFNQAAPMAHTLLLAYRNPKPRVHALTIDVDATTGLSQGGHTAADLLFALELTAPVTVIKQKPGALGINRAMVIEGITHDITPDLGGHTITLQLTEATNINPAVWILGTSGLGVDNGLSWGVPNFDPTSIANCSLYLRADVGVATSGATVTQWNDQSGNSRHATAVSGSVGPQLVGAYLDWATGQYMNLPSSPFDVNWTVFIVSNPYSAGGATYSPSIIYDGDGGVGAGHTYHYVTNDGSSDTMTAHDRDGTNVVFVGGPVVAGFSIGCAISAAGQPLKLYTNGDAGVSASAAGALTSFATTVHTIGGDPSQGSGAGIFPRCLARVKAIIVYTRALTDAERQYVTNGLNTLFTVF